MAETMINDILFNEISEALTYIDGIRKEQKGKEYNDNKVDDKGAVTELVYGIKCDFGTTIIFRVKPEGDGFRLNHLVAGETKEHIVDDLDFLF